MRRRERRNTNPTLQKVRSIEAPKLAALSRRYLSRPEAVSPRIAAIYKERKSLNLDPESLRLVEYYYDQFVHAGANLSDADKTELKKLNEEIATLSNTFSTKLLAATKERRLRDDGQSSAGRLGRRANRRRC